MCGFPALSLPSGVSGGLPSGVSGGRPQAVQLIAARQAEATLLAAAAWCEQVLSLRLTPMTPGCPR